MINKIELKEDGEHCKCNSRTKKLKVGYHFEGENPICNTCLKERKRDDK